MSFISPAPQGTETRTDQGVDWANVRGNIVAVASGTIAKIYSGLSGFGTTIIERLSSGQEVYYAEESGGGSPVVHVGQAVRQGQALAPGTGGVIEAGFWDPTTGRSMGAPGYHEGMVTQAGLRFRHAIGGVQGWRVQASQESLGGTGSCGHPIQADGYSELSVVPASRDFRALGDLPCGTVLNITNPANGKTVQAAKQDIGAGSAFLPVMGLYPGTAAKLGLSGGQYTVIISRADGGDLHPARGTMVNGAAAGNAGRTRPGGGSSEDTGEAVEKVLADYEAELTLPRTAPANGFTPASRAGWKAPFQWWYQSFTSQWESEQGQ